MTSQPTAGALKPLIARTNSSIDTSNLPEVKLKTSVLGLLASLEDPGHVVLSARPIDHQSWSLIQGTIVDERPERPHPRDRRRSRPKARGPPAPCRQHPASSRRSSRSPTINPPTVAVRTATTP